MLRLGGPVGTPWRNPKAVFQRIDTVAGWKENSAAGEVGA